MKGIVNSKIYYGDQFLESHVIIYDNKIEGIVHEKDLDGWLENRADIGDIQWIDGESCLVIPGLIDVHIHGYKGYDVMDGSKESVLKIAKGITANGVTSFLPTTMTMTMSYIENALESVRVVKGMNHEGANVLGAHMEGPFINKAYKGAQLEEAIIAPSQELVERYKDVIKVVTIAPEVLGATELIERYKDTIRFSMGHSGATYEQACHAIEKGVSGCTHLFNAMTGLHHRKPGIVGAAFNNDIYSELIADTIHVHPSLFELVIREMGLDKLLLITDCMSGGGLEDGIYYLGGQEVTLKDGICLLEDGTIAGSVLKLDQALRNMNDHVTHKLEEILPLVTMNQATYLGLEKEIGSLEVGKQADIVIMDHDLTVKKTIVKGVEVYAS